MAKVTYLPEARSEYESAVEWYLDRNPASARRFLAELERIEIQIGHQPDRYGWYDENFREAALKTFPYSIVYRVEATGDVTIMAVAHGSREAGYWKDRAN